VEPPAPKPASAEHRFLFGWLAQAARRAQTRERLSYASRALCVLLSSLALYLLAALHLPAAVLAALAPLLLLTSAAAVAFCAWRCTRRPDLSAVAAEADARSGLKDELRSAHWFARQDATSAWEALVLGRAARTLRGLDPAHSVPLRLPASFGAAMVLGVAVLALALGGRDASGLTGDRAEGAGGPQAQARAGGRAAAGQEEGLLRRATAARTPAQAAETSALWKRAEALARTLQSSEAGAELQRAMQAGDVARVRELLQAAEQVGPAASAGLDARAQAARVSAEVAQGILERLQSLVGEGSEPKPMEAQSANGPTDGVSGWRDDGKRETQRRESEQETTMDALNDALRALSQAATGDRQMATSSPGQPAPDNSSTNINGGALGMRVNTSQAGEGGEDTPPDAPSEGLGEPVLGKPTVRLAAQLQRVATKPSEGESAAGASEGFYAATRAQASRVDFAAVDAAPPRTQEAALAREQVPVAYRASVKRYFLTEHSKEH
jgi:hypothetical protein